MTSNPSTRFRARPRSQQLSFILVRCMPRSHAAIVAAAFILFGCHHDAPLPETSPDAEPLRWLDHADVVADFTEHVEHQRDTRFVSVFAFSPAGALGLDDTPEMRQLVQRHGERHIEGTTDIITERRAAAFAAEGQRLRWEIQCSFATLPARPPQHLTGRWRQPRTSDMPSFLCSLNVSRNSRGASSCSR